MLCEIYRNLWMTYGMINRCTGDNTHFPKIKLVILGKANLFGLAQLKIIGPPMGILTFVDQTT